MKIIFLDIDGTMVTSYKGVDGGRPVANPACVDALNHITTATGAEIVISSIWRYQGLMFMREKCRAWGIQAPVRDVTPDLRSSMGRLSASWPRTLEISKWIEDTEDWRPIESFVVLDDERMQGELAAHSIHLSREFGLTMSDAERAISMLEVAVR